MIYFVHGWGGQAAHFRKFVAHSAERFRLLLLDLPAHGQSAGRKTTIPKMTDALFTVADEFGPPNAVVAHSVGAACTSLAIRRGLPAEAAVFIAPPATVDGMVDKICSRFSIGDRATQLLKQRLSHQFGADSWNELSTIYQAGQMSVPLRIIHDVDDIEVPINEARLVANEWPNAELVETKGLGHYGPLTNEAAIADCIEWLSQRLQVRREA